MMAKMDFVQTVAIKRKGKATIKFAKNLELTYCRDQFGHEKFYITDVKGDFEITQISINFSDGSKWDNTYDKVKNEFLSYSTSCSATFYITENVVMKEMKLVTYELQIPSTAFLKLHHFLKKEFVLPGFDGLKFTYYVKKIRESGNEENDVEIHVENPYDVEIQETKCKCDKTYLNCDSNEIENLNIHIIAEHFTVKSVNFENNGITILKKKFILPGREYSIQSIDFSYNKILLIENGAFDEFKKLENLTLSENFLKSINENVLTESLGKTLIHLDLKDTKLQKITSKTFVNMKKLEYLSLSMNPALMPYFDKKVFSTSFMNLKQLDLTWCNISTLEDDVFINLINLERLDFHRNPITTVPKAFKLLSNLQILDFSHNPITVMEKAYFPYIPNLKELHLIGMENLTTINDCAFCNLPNLEKISLSFNDHLTFLHENAFGSISSGKLYSKIKEIDIIVPKLPSISERLVDWSKTDKFRFRTKIYICDCSMAWLISDLQRSDSIFSKKINLIGEKCINPPQLKGKKLSEVSGKICNGKLSTLYHPSTSTSVSTFNFHWIFLIGIIFGIAILCFIFHKKILKFVYFRNIPEYESDTNKLFRYSNLEADSISM